MLLHFHTQTNFNENFINCTIAKTRFYRGFNLFQASSPFFPAKIILTLNFYLFFFLFFLISLSVMVANANNWLTFKQNHLLFLFYKRPNFLGTEEKAETWDWRRMSDDTYFRLLEASSDSKKKAMVGISSACLCFCSIQYQLSVVSNLTSLNKPLLLVPRRKKLH